MCKRQRNVSPDSLQEKQITKRMVRHGTKVQRSVEFPFLEISEKLIHSIFTSFSSALNRALGQTSSRAPFQLALFCEHKQGNLDTINFFFISLFLFSFLTPKGFLHGGAIVQCVQAGLYSVLVFSLPPHPLLRF